MNNLLSYCGLVDARIGASDKYLPVICEGSLSKLINENEGGIFCLLHGKLQAGWKENLKNLSELALLFRDFRVMLVRSNQTTYPPFLEIVYFSAVRLLASSCDNFNLFYHALI